MLALLQGGGAGGQDVYVCSLLADEAPLAASPIASGICIDAFDAGRETIDTLLVKGACLRERLRRRGLHGGPRGGHPRVRGADRVTGSLSLQFPPFERGDRREPSLPRTLGVAIRFTRDFILV